jgi:two-component sensor histidine kinase
MDTAIPCGLIVHELISNAVRHAFPEGVTGHVSLSLHLDRDEQIELTVSDSGRGFPETAGHAGTQSLGLRLVYLLAAQLDAAVERSGQAGTQYRFLFKPGKSKEKQSNEQASHSVGRG